uniref:Putative secreted protein n=1 Tax=Lutzomyia longipalpis TaxID=7200 RepID=A0A1B0CW33_LUTLO
MGNLRWGGMIVIEGVFFTCFLFSVVALSAPVAPEFESGTILDLNNPDPNILRQHNINITTIRNRQAALKNRNNIFTASSSSIRNNESFQQNPQSSGVMNSRKIFEERALEEIKETIARNILWNDTRPGGSSNSPSYPNSHDIAAYPQCQLPRNTNETFWNEGNSYNLFFELPNNCSQYESQCSYIEIDASGTGTSERRNQTRQGNDCGQVDELIRITVSAYVKKHRKAERKKRIYSSTMVDKFFVGWVELDVRQAVKLWEKPNKNLGLAIDVHDQDDNLLRASQSSFSTVVRHPRSHGASSVKIPGLILQWRRCLATPE